MAVQITPAVPVFVVVALLAATLSVYGAVQYHSRGHQSELLAFISLMIAVTLWQLTQLFTHVTTVPALKQLGTNLVITGIVWTFVYSLLWFALAYTDTDRWVTRWTAGIAVGWTVALTAAVLLSPELLYEIRGIRTRGPVTILGVTFQQWLILDRAPTPLLLVTQLCGYLLTLLSGAVLGRYLLRNRGALYTGQAVALAVGVGTPLVANFLLFAGIVPPERNPTTISLGVTCLGFGVAIFRYRLLRVAPLGRQQLVDRMDDPVVMVDDEGRVVDSNPAARDLVDAPVGWRGMTAADFFAPFPDQFAQFRDATAVDTEITVEIDGTTRHFDLNISRIESRTGEPGGRLVVLRDITARKEREQRLEATTRELEQSNEKLEEFASVVSHDLRNPLGIARTYLNFARDTGSAEDFAAIEESLDRMDEMIDGLLTMARVGTTVEETEEHALAPLVEAGWETAQTDGATLVSELPAGATVDGDPSLLQHVFENCFRNAVEHGSTGSRAQPGDSVEHNDSPLQVRVGTLPNGFYIEDDGRGIPPEQREAVFEHGYTSDDDGTGLGLSIVNDIVTAHGWTVAVTASEDGGARFEITTE